MDSVYKTHDAKDVHVCIAAQQISAFVDCTQRRSTLICFRCGQEGHTRGQCLTFKVRLCERFEQGECADASSCAYAHGTDELRHPWRVKCIRVIKHDGKLICIGCNSSEHTFRKCPLHQDLMYL